MRAVREMEPPVSAADDVRDENLERASLTCFMRGVRLDEVDLPPDAYANPAHRQIYVAAQQAAKRLRVVDVAAVRAVLSREGAPPEVVELAEFIAAGDAKPEHIHGYTEGLLECHGKRTNIRAMEDGIRQMRDARTRRDVVAAEVAAVLASTQNDGAEGPGGDDVRSLRADIQEAREAKADPKKPRRRAFIATPFAGFNDKHDPMRGFPCRKGASAIGVIAARSGTGKTGAIATLLHFWICVLQMKTGLVGLEDGTRWLIERWAARDFGLDWGDVVEQAATGEHFVMPFQVPWLPVEWSSGSTAGGEPCFTLDDVLDGYERLLDLNLVRYRGANIASAKLLALSRKWITREGVQAIMVDHGLRVDYSPGKNERLDLAIMKGIQGLTGITVETGVPIVLAWHLNRKGEEDAPPSMSDIKESGYLDADAALVLAAYRQPSTGRTLLTVLKSRKSGGLNRIVELVWAGRSGMFSPDQCGVVDLQAERMKLQQERKAEREGKAKLL